MVQIAQPRKASPRALTGKVLAINGAVFLVLGALLAGYILFLLAGAASTPGFALLLVAEILSAVFGALGLSLLLVGLLLRWLPGESPTATAVDQFYTALEHQDYMTAFQYLDPSTRTPQGQIITPAWLAQNAQAYDSAEGPVTNYALAGVRANPGMRVFTIKVTRRSGSYRTRLRLQKQGYDWKIMGFDRF